MAELEDHVKKETSVQEEADGSKVAIKIHDIKQSSSPSDSEADDNRNKVSPLDDLALPLETLSLETPKMENKHTEVLEKTSKISGKKLLIFDLNGLLIHKVHFKDSMDKVPMNRNPDAVLFSHRVYKRPFVDGFLNFCLERFEVALWSSAMERNMDGVMDKCFDGLKKRPLFIWDQKFCTDFGFKTLEKKDKPMFFKDLKKVWSRYGHPEKGPFTSTNTLLIDDKPYKALLNPQNTAIFPASYNVHDPLDNVLDPKGEMATWLDGLFHAEDVPSYVAANPFGQSAIKEGHCDWPFYSNILRYPRVAAHVSTV